MSPVSFSWRRELAIGLGSYAAYLGVRHAVLARSGPARGRRNAERILALERRLRLDGERRVQDVALRVPHVVRGLGAGYAVLNVGLSVGWLIHLYRTRDVGFPRERRAAVAAFLGALPVFLAMPTAPPRTLDGFVDVLGESGVDLDHPLLQRFYNPLAAMPSQHLAFAVVTGTALARRGTGLHGAVWAAYPPFVAVIVVATGNHFLLDVAGGALLGALSRRLTR